MIDVTDMMCKRRGAFGAPPPAGKEACLLLVSCVEGMMLVVKKQRTVVIHLVRSEQRWNKGKHQL